MQRTALGLLLLVGCGDPVPGDTHDHHHHHEEGCHAEDDLDAYVQGLSKTGEAGIRVAIAAADPAPPDVGVNQWTLEVEDSTGAALGEGAEVVVVPFMPQHGHGSSPAEFAATAGEGLAWELPPMDLFMPGLWELTVEVAQDGEPVDQVVFRFCLEG